MKMNPPVSVGRVAAWLRRGHEFCGHSECAVPIPVGMVSESCLMLSAVVKAMENGVQSDVEFVFSFIYSSRVSIAAPGG